MVNKSLFPQSTRAGVPSTDAVNEAGGTAYTFTPKHALAQYAMTGCLNSTFYVRAEDQLATLIDLAAKVDPVFIGKLAVYSRTEGYMKDTPALLAAILAKRDVAVLRSIFSNVINDAKMLRNFVQIIRKDASGKIGRKSFGTAIKRLIQGWLDSQTEDRLFRQSVGQTPSLEDIIKMVHPKPKSKEREAFYAYILDKKDKGYKEELLPASVRAFEAFKRAPSEGEIPEIPFQMLTSFALSSQQWAQIALNCSWQTLRMNLATFARHGVFNLSGLTELVAARLRDPSLVRKAKVFPYQLLMAYKATEDDGKGVPQAVRNALQDALEIALENIPTIDGQVYVFPDVSGSMRSPVTGGRGSATSKVQCVDVAALVSAAFMRKNPDKTVVMPFDTSVHSTAGLNPRDSVMTNAAKLAQFGGGGTACSLPLIALNQRKAKGDLVIYVSDSESWADGARWTHSQGYGLYTPFGRNTSVGTSTQAAWQEFKSRNPKAKLVCIDITPNGTTQAKENADILNIGGFSDTVFEIVSLFAKGQLGADHWVGVIEEGVRLDA
jgi:60 kDa SS-A/Ro ribonucleoprotein